MSETQEPDHDLVASGGVPHQYPSADAAHSTGHHDLSTAGVTRGGVDTAHPDEVDVIGLVNVLLKRWKLVAGFPLALTCRVGIMTLIIPPRFTATTTFVPETGSDQLAAPGAVAGLASQFGLSVPGSENSLCFYADVLRSRSIGDEVLESRFPQMSVA